MKGKDCSPATGSPVSLANTVSDDLASSKNGVQESLTGLILSHPFPSNLARYSSTTTGSQSIEYALGTARALASLRSVSRDEPVAVVAVVGAAGSASEEATRFRRARPREVACEASPSVGRGEGRVRGEADAVMVII